MILDILSLFKTFRLLQVILIPAIKFRMLGIILDSIAVTRLTLTFGIVSYTEGLVVEADIIPISLIVLSAAPILKGLV